MSPLLLFLFEEGVNMNYVKRVRELEEENKRLSRELTLLNKKYDSCLVEKQELEDRFRSMETTMSELKDKWEVEIHALSEKRKMYDTLIEDVMNIKNLFPILGIKLKWYQRLWVNINLFFSSRFKRKRK